MSQPNKHHNLRQRKKLRLGEFQQMGFPFSAKCPAGWTEDQREQAMWSLMNTIEDRGLDYGGGDSASGLDGYVMPADRGSAGDEDREAIRALLESLGFESIDVGALEDAWYPGENDAAS